MLDHRLKAETFVELQKQLHLSTFDGAEITTEEMAGLIYYGRGDAEEIANKILERFKVVKTIPEDGE